MRHGGCYRPRDRLGTMASRPMTTARPSASSATAERVLPLVAPDDPHLPRERASQASGGFGIELQKTVIWRSWVATSLLYLAIFRSSIPKPPAADSFRQGWEEAQGGEALPVERLW